MQTRDTGTHTQHLCLDGCGLRGGKNAGERRRIRCCDDERMEAQSNQRQPAFTICVSRNIRDIISNISFTHMLTQEHLA